MNKLLESTTRVRFHDCDPFNHLNNSRYLDYLMTARTDQLEANYNLDIYQLAQQKAIGWVTAQTQISYLSPALVNEVVTIQTQLLAFGPKSLLFEALMFNSGKSVLKAVLWGKLVHIDLTTQRSHAHSPELMQLFEQVVNPLSPDQGFEERVASLKSMR